MSQVLESVLGACPGEVSQGILLVIMALGVAVTYRILDYADLTVDSSLCTGAAVNAVLLLAGVHPIAALAAATALDSLVLFATA